MQQDNQDIVSKISNIIDTLPSNWASVIGLEMKVSEQAVRAYARGERCKKNQHINLLKELIKYQTSLNEEIAQLISN